MEFKYMPNDSTVIMIEVQELQYNRNPNKWVAIPQPSSMTYISEDYDSEESGRTLSLRMIRDRIGTKCKFELEWSYIKLDDIKELLRLVKAESFWVRFVDPETGDYAEIEMYAGSKTLPYYNTLRDEYGQPVIGFQSISINFIQM